MMHVGNRGLIILELTFSQAGQIYKLKKGTMLLNRQVSKVSPTGICFSSRGCKSVNCNGKSFECHLNNRAVLSSSSELNTAPDSDFTEITSPANNNLSGCMGHPDVVNGHFNNDPQNSPSGVKLPLVCDPGYIVHDEVVCQENGTWSSPMCVSVSSCSMVKQYQSTSGDGQYWLRLTNFDNYITRIYCHGMSTSSPEEFLTLSYVNYGTYPRLMSEFCDGQDYELKKVCWGGRWKNMVPKNQSEHRHHGVIQHDRTFANISNNGKYLAYGIAYDCYTTHPHGNSRCGTRGNFTIDLRGTGWKVSQHQQWTKYRYAAIEGIYRLMNGALIILRCGGFGSGCKPLGGLFLTPNR